MKELLITLVEYFFYNNPDEETNAKTLIITFIKVIIFISLVTFILWLLLKNN